MPIVLPTTSTEAIEINPKVLIIYGAPKVGKTSVLSMLPSLLHIDTENGTDYIKGLKVKVNNLYELIELCKLLEAPAAPKYNFIAYDTIDMIESWCEWSATEVYKGTVLGKQFKEDTVLKLPKGAGYLWLRQEFNKYFDRLAKLTKYTIFVCHIRDKAIIAGDNVLQQDGTFREVKADEVDYKDIDLTGKIRSIACSKADAIGHMFRDKTNKLYISFRGNETVNCGSRCEHLKGQVFEFDWNKIYLNQK